MHLRRLPVLIAACGLLLTGCGSPAAAGGDGNPQRERVVTVLAAASLTDVVDDLARRFEARHPDLRVVADYGGSAALAQQIVSGAPADVFFSADEATMRTVVDAGLALSPQVLVTNALEIAVPPGNPGGVTGLADLGDDDLTVALCDHTVPCGAASDRLLELAGVEASADTLEQDVRAVLTKVALGEADAGLVYLTDVTAAAGDVEGIPAGHEDEVRNAYPISVLTDAREPEAAQRLVGFLSSPEAEEVFADAGFHTS